MLLRQRTYVARKLRRDATEVEKRLWRAVRELLPDYRFRRQHLIGPYIADFVCPTKKLVIELDGGQRAIRQGVDNARTRGLGRRGYRVIRFWNSDVVENLMGVVEPIRSELGPK
jgi:very-short-patch-repair endonuclease